MEESTCNAVVCYGEPNCGLSYFVSWITGVALPLGVLYFLKATADSYVKNRCFAGPGNSMIKCYFLMEPLILPARHMPSLFSQKH